MPRMQPGGGIMVKNVRLAFTDKEEATRTWTLVCHEGRVQEILPTSIEDLRSTELPKSGEVEAGATVILDGRGGLLLPSFCHSHIHLDKCYILDRCGDLLKGDFAEAMRVTKLAKGDFSDHPEDLYSRGERIIRQSVEYGVTAMRAHVEIDTSVGFACLEAAQRLQEVYRSHCDVQIAIFAQEPLFDAVEDADPGENLALLRQAAESHGVSVVGSAPYVEPSVKQAKSNISLIFDIADAQGIEHVDFHLDYNLDPGSEPLIYEVVAQAKRRYYQRSSSSGNGGAELSATPNNLPNGRHCPRITIGHATRLQLFSEEQWRELAGSISDLPITFVGLPQSDIYMQGRAFVDQPLGPPRGTLRVPYLARKYGIEVAMAVNNVENAFTPQGSLDPLSLCTFGVAVFQASTPDDIRSLSRSVTLTSKTAIGIQVGTRQQFPPAFKSSSPKDDLVPTIGDQADFVILHGHGTSIQTLQSVVLNPPFERTTIKGGKVVASTRAIRWIAP